LRSDLTALFGLGALRIVTSTEPSPVVPATIRAPPSILASVMVSFARLAAAGTGDGATCWARASPAIP
jgi:hypothetical protein